MDDDSGGGSIGGLDIFFDTDDPPQQVTKKIKKIFARYWPLATYEFDNTLSDSYDLEVFVYRNRYWRKKWDDEGAVEETANTMFYIMLSGHQFTLVIDSITPETKPIIDDLITELGTSEARLTSGRRYSYAS